jgi:hypothetical protein
MKRFFRLFTESTFEGSRAVAREMKKIANRQIKEDQKFQLFHSLGVLVRCSNSEMLLWPNSPRLVMLHFFDPSVLLGDGETRLTLLHRLADLADPFEYSTHKIQLILAKQLVEHSANIIAVSIPDGITPLHTACHDGNVTNLDFVELLLKAGADPNTQDHLGLTPLMYTMPNAPGAAKVLLNWPTTDANITTRDGRSFLAVARLAITAISDQIKHPLNPDKIQEEFSLQQ